MMETSRLPGPVSEPGTGVQRQKWEPGPVVQSKILPEPQTEIEKRMIGKSASIAIRLESKRAGVVSR